LSDMKREWVDGSDNPIGAFEDKIINDEIACPKCGIATDFLDVFTGNVGDSGTVSDSYTMCYWCSECDAHSYIDAMDYEPY
jgi:hypothetical protein